MFLLFVLLYFGGYPAIQFDARHYFHLEFITWWASAFSLQAAISDVWPLVRGRQRSPALDGVGAPRRIACSGMRLASWSPLCGPSFYQQNIARACSDATSQRTVEEIPPDPSSPPDRRAFALTRPGTDPETADFLEVDVNEHRCGPNPSVTFRYDPARLGRDFLANRSFCAVPRSGASTHIFDAVYDDFQAIEVSDSRPAVSRGSLA